MSRVSFFSAIFILCYSVNIFACEYRANLQEIGGFLLANFEDIELINGDGSCLADRLNLAEFYHSCKSLVHALKYDTTSGKYQLDAEKLHTPTFSDEEYDDIITFLKTKGRLQFEHADTLGLDNAKQQSLTALFHASPKAITKSLQSSGYVADVLQLKGLGDLLVQKTSPRDQAPLIAKQEQDTAWYHVVTHHKLRTSTFVSTACLCYWLGKKNSNLF